uniref:Uncharacterized protein n=1 Tax=Arundo donax TaxID=35708 RepID=A0A0A9EQD5_ARUDO
MCYASSRLLVVEASITFSK